MKENVSHEDIETAKKSKQIQWSASSKIRRPSPSTHGAEEEGDEVVRFVLDTCLIELGDGWYKIEDGSNDR